MNIDHLVHPTPDLEQPVPEEPHSFGIESLSAPRLVTWAADEPSLEGVLSGGVVLR